MGCTACARRISSELASEMPRYFTFPSATSSCAEQQRAVHHAQHACWGGLHDMGSWRCSALTFRHAHVSSMGLLLSTRCW